MLLCGLAETDITPPLGSSIPGSTAERKGSGISDPLFAKVWAVEAEQATLIFIVIDGLFIPGKEADLIRERIYAHAGLKPEQIIVSATHAHTGPPVRIGLDGSDNSAYLAELVQKVSAAAADAYDRRKPAVIGWGAGHVDDVSFNRRYWMKDGTLRTNPGYSNPDIVRPAGPIDPLVHVIRIDDADGTPMGVFTNFACHPDTVGGTLYGGDYPAVLSRELKARLGSDVVSLFALGACGDINHCDFSKERQSGVTERIGRRLAEEVLQVREKISLHASADAAAVRTFIEMELREPTAEELIHARSVVEGGTIVGPERFFADQILQVSRMSGGKVQLEIQAVRLGDFAYVGLPGEIFVELGLAIKQASPYAHTAVGALTNGSIYGYVCTAEAYEQGGYEPRLKTFNRLLPGTGERMVEAAGQLLQKIGKE